ncbi:MAG: hypothetical protein R6W76_00975 [Caldilinea sp.]
MPDFLTRLVTATYIPAASVRPRPVAHYEPVDATLPVQPAVYETPTPPLPTLTGETSASHAESRSLSVAPQRIEHAVQDVQPSPRTRSGEMDTPRLDVQPTEDGSIAMRAQAANWGEMHPPAPPPGPSLASHARNKSVLSAPGSVEPPSVQREPMQNAKLTSMHPIADEALLQSAQTLASPLRAAITPELEIRPRSLPIAPVDEQESAVGASSTQGGSLAARHEGLLRASTLTPAEHRVDSGQEDGEEADAAPVTLRNGRLVDSQGRALAAPPVGVNPTSPSAPIIRVSIGRIVVKAEPPATAKQASPRPAPVRPALSLDGYLKTRSGGGA